MTKRALQLSCLDQENAMLKRKRMILKALTFFVHSLHTKIQHNLKCKRMVKVMVRLRMQVITNSNFYGYIRQTGRSSYWHATVIL